MCVGAEKKKNLVFVHSPDSVNMEINKVPQTEQHNTISSQSAMGAYFRGKGMGRRDSGVFVRVFAICVYEFGGGAYEGLLRAGVDLFGC